MENDPSVPPSSGSSEPPPIPEAGLNPPSASPPEVPIVPPEIPIATTGVEPPPVPGEAMPKAGEPPPVGEAVSQVVASVGKELEGMATEKNLAMFCHLSALVGGVLFSAIGLPVGNIVGPLIIWLIKKDTMPMVNEHGKEALNFQITVSAIILACMALFFLVLPLLLIPIVGIAALVLTIIGTVKASNGVLYRYPLTLRLIK
jgi:uncharacterized protein